MKFRSLGVGIFVLSTFAFVFVYAYTALAVDVWAMDISFGSWRIGQGAPWASTFITNSETSCSINTTVQYDPDTFPFPIIDGPDWNVTMTHGFSFANADDTARYEKTASGNAHVPSSHPSNGRGNTPMQVTMNVTITCGSDSDSDGALSKTIIKTVKQDTIDQIRQEYVDHSITVPARSQFGSDRGDRYDNQDDYGYAIHKPARSNLAAWRAEFKRVMEISNDIEISSGYRNPEHNLHHVGGVPNSNHQYGIAIDGAIMDYNGNGVSSDDRLGMHNAARNLNLQPLPANTYRSHIHIGG